MTLYGIYEPEDVDRSKKYEYRVTTSSSKTKGRTVEKKVKTL